MRLLIFTAASICRIRAACPLVCIRRIISSARVLITPFCRPIDTLSQRNGIRFKRTILGSIAIRRSIAYCTAPFGCSQRHFEKRTTKTVIAISSPPTSSTLLKEELAIYAQHKYAGTWHETESPFEKMVRERLMVSSAKKVTGCCSILE